MKSREVFARLSFESKLYMQAAHERLNAADE
jgi:hypothetical protein